MSQSSGVPHIPQWHTPPSRKPLLSTSVRVQKNPRKLCSIIISPFSGSQIPPEIMGLNPSLWDVHTNDMTNLQDKEWKWKIRTRSRSWVGKSSRQSKSLGESQEDEMQNTVIGMYNFSLFLLNILCVFSSKSVLTVLLQQLLLTAAPLPLPKLIRLFCFLPLQKMLLSTPLLYLHQTRSHHDWINGYQWLHLQGQKQ